MRKTILFLLLFSTAIIFLMFVALIVNRIVSSDSKNSSHNNRKLSQSTFEKNKIDKVFKRYNNYVYGVDFSHYQGVVSWENIKNIHDSTPVSFVFLRATMGKLDRDKHFKYNWEEAEKHGITTGAYHYYRPNENSTKQANNFIKNVKLVKGNLPPVLDIEKLPSKQSLRSLKIGLVNWLTIIEKHYGVKPIIYSGDTFYTKHLSSGEFDSYIIWIANFNRIINPKTTEWKLWQFSEKGVIQGVNERVDFNVFKGSYADFEKLLVK